MLEKLTIQLLPKDIQMNGASQPKPIKVLLLTTKKYFKQMPFSLIYQLVRQSRQPWHLKMQ
jgi:predicted ATPase with chaperone activity